MGTPNFSGAVDVAQFYGAGPFRILSQTIVGAGGTSNPTISAAGATSNPPCASEIVSAAYNSATGTYLLTFAGNHFAVAFADATVDDINGTSPVNAYLGQWTGLNSNAPLTCILTTYVNNAASNLANGTPVRIFIVFKDDTTGAAA